MVCSSKLQRSKGKYAMTKLVDSPSHQVKPTYIMFAYNYDYNPIYGDAKKSRTGD